MSKEIKLWAIGGPTRGAGRTTLTGALCKVAASKGLQVTLVDGDLMGQSRRIAESQKGISYSNKNRDRTLKKIFSACSSEFPRSVENIFERLLQTPENSLSINRKLKNIEKIVILDLAPSLSNDVLDLWLAADARIMVARPGKSSFKETFQFLTTALLRDLEVMFKNEPRVLELLTSAWTGNQQVNGTIDHIRNKIDLEAPQSGVLFRYVISQFKVNMVINGVNWMEAERFAEELLDGSRELIGSGARFLGCLSFDENSTKIVKAIRPFILDSEDNPELIAVARTIAEKMKDRFKKCVAEREMYERPKTLRANVNMKFINTKSKFNQDIVTGIQSLTNLQTKIEDREFIKRIPL